MDKIRNAPNIKLLFRYFQKTQNEIFLFPGVKLAKNALQSLPFRIH